MQKSLLSRLWSKSQTKFLAYVQGSSAAFLALLSNASSFFNDPHIKDYLANFEVPKSVYILFATMAVLTWLAHGREEDA